MVKRFLNQEVLITAIFISNVRILTSVRTTNENPNIDLHVPTFSTFLHKCYHESAKEFYKNPYLFDDKIKNSEKRIK